MTFVKILILTFLSFLRYTIIEYVGKGAYGVVQKAFDDRFILTELRYRLPGAYDKLYVENERSNLDDNMPDLQTYAEKENLDMVCVYLANFSYEGLFKLFETVQQQKLMFQVNAFNTPKSRYTFIEFFATYHSMIRRNVLKLENSTTHAFALKSIGFKSSRPVVVLKISVVENATSDKKKALLDSGAREVFAHTQTSCTTPVVTYVKNDLSIFRNQPQPFLDNDRYMEYDPIGVATPTLQVIAPLVDYCRDNKGNIYLM